MVEDKSINLSKYLYPNIFRAVNSKNNAAKSMGNSEDNAPETGKKSPSLSLFDPPYLATINSQQENKNTNKLGLFDYLMNGLFAFKPQATTTSNEVKDSIIKVKKQAEDLAGVHEDAAISLIQNRDSIADQILAKARSEGYASVTREAIYSLIDKDIAFNVNESKILLNGSRSLNALAESNDYIQYVMNSGKVKIGANDRREVVETDIKRWEELNREIPVDQVSQSIEDNAKIEKSLKGIANGNADLLAKINSSNILIAKILADKLLPTENASDTDIANASRFVNGIFELPVLLITSNLTQAILDQITENNEMNRKADDLAYQRSSEERKFRSIEDLKVALRKSSEKIALLRNYENKLSEVADEDKNKILAQILGQLQKPNPLI